MTLLAALLIWFRPEWTSQLQIVVQNASMWVPAAGLALAAAILFDLSPARRH
jgi:hypothetical protein